MIMKLRNKKTGEIGWLENYYGDTDEKMIAVLDRKTEYHPYNSLAELNEEWEDYEEPKEYWFVNDLDGEPMKCELRYCPVRDYDDWVEKRKQIGNYFETREEAEKVVEKLKAWERLKGAITRIDRASFDDVGTATLFIRYKGKDHKKVKKDLDLLFGGEE